MPKAGQCIMRSSRSPLFQKLKIWDEVVPLAWSLVRTALPVSPYGCLNNSENACNREVTWYNRMQRELVLLSYNNHFEKLKQGPKRSTRIPSAGSILRDPITPTWLHCSKAPPPPQVATPGSKPLTHYPLGGKSHRLHFAWTWLPLLQADIICLAAAHWCPSSC